MPVICKVDRGLQSTFHMKQWSHWPSVGFSILLTTFYVILQFFPPTHLNQINWWLPLDVHLRVVLDPWFLRLLLSLAHHLLITCSSQPRYSNHLSVLHLLAHTATLRAPSTGHQFNCQWCQMMSSLLWKYKCFTVVFEVH
jgi:hypothetical protein